MYKGYRVFVSLSLSLHSLGVLNASEVPTHQNDSAVTATPYTNKTPYAPMSWDYGAGFGLFNHQRLHYQLSGQLGKHLGECLFVNTTTCQQYIDLLGDLSGREGSTLYGGKLSFRWQFVNFPSNMSPFFRIQAGLVNAIEKEGVMLSGVGGLGLGLNYVLHPRLDLRIEGRQEYYRSLPVQTFLLGFQFKIDNWVSDFADSMKDIGTQTIETPRNLMEALIINPTRKKSDSEKQPNVEQKQAPSKEAQP
ncbi:MAG: hypothetical protein COT74_13655 [Bdellovibrionales bacterium CG10_big_fil_rev_8_21_14_0_10_45_34]|nr:MAG: hypothetical protein COT74_13655 [Bdellovibrionales bacterium CG10_big_fil_rev_8_21_14_0_10_45_34]